MKRKIITTAIACMLFPLANAQGNKSASITSKLKADVFIGHSLFGGGTALGEQSQYDNMSKLISEKQLYGSAGNGLIYGANINYFPVSFFGVGAGFSHLSGNWQTHNGYSYSNGYSSTEEFRGTYNSISLDVVLRTGCEGKMHGQASFGPSFFPGSNLYYKEIRGANGSADYDIQRTITNAAGIGLNAGFGGDYQVTERIAIGIDFRSTIFNATGKKEMYTKFMDNGDNNLLDMKTNEKETVYVSEFTQSSNRNGLDGYDKNKPNNELAPKTNYNNFMGVVRATFSF